MLDNGIKAELRGIVRALREYVNETHSKLTTRIVQLEGRLNDRTNPEHGEKGDPGPQGPEGRPGKDAIINYEYIISEVIPEIIKRIPIAQDGKDGRDGKDSIVDYPSIIAEIVKLIPTPKDGNDGKDGAKGEQGPRGIKGDDGPPGRDGESIIGPPGIQGLKGEKGDPGLNGRDGVDGKNGRDGDPGKDGINGIDGKDGRPGEIGPRGEKGDRGEKGEPGMQGIEGKQGPMGPAGGDALQIDILPAIDLSRSYPRGTFAKYEGGIIWSYRETVPGQPLEKAGWEVIVAGIAQTKVSLSDDSRIISLGIRKTGEEAYMEHFKIPAMIYRGIFNQGDKYSQGDVVTWSGSAWHCQVDNPKSVPGTSETDWRLMVKEGRKGKDGQEGKQGPPGPAGRDGKNLIDFSGDKR